MYPYRLRGRYFVIAIDGTGRLTFPECHCPHCLTVTHHGKTTYYHPVLEAQLVCPNGGAFSIMTEFVENPAAYPSKQDCELKAFYRLAKRLKQAFPRLPICLSLDGLFAGGPTMTLCEDYDWQYMIMCKRTGGFVVSSAERFNLEHAYTHDPVASKIFYFLLQIAHLLAQLIEHGSLVRQAFPAGVGSAKNIAFRLLEAWRNRRLSAAQIQEMLHIRRQIRFAPP